LIKLKQYQRKYRGYLRYLDTWLDLLLISKSRAASNNAE
jgi:hypothetical protein